MKRIAVIAVLSLVIGLGAGWLAFRPSDAGNSSSERKILYYRDPMSPQITSPTPKKAADGMDFVPVYDESSGTSGEKTIAFYRDPMHPWYTSDKPGKAPDCGMDLVPVYEGQGDSKGIKIDPVTVQNIGVKIATVERRKLSKVIRAVGKVDFDETKVYSVNTKIMGWVEKLHVDYTGKVVQKGDPLMELYSPELVSTQEEYLQAIRYRKQLQQSSIEEARTGADELIESAKRRLLYWDISESEIQQLEKRGSPRKTMTIYSPVEGIVMEKMVFKGQNVMAGMDLYKIADLSTLWVLADIYQYELPWVKVGQQANVELSYLPGKTFRGTITYVYPTLNMETKTAKVRVVVSNTASLDLKPEMFATVKIISPVAVDAVAIPNQAIIRSGERNIAVIALGGGYFDPREIRLGVMADGYVQVLDGIKEGEKIVTSSQFLIDSESNLKAAVGLMRGHEGHDMSPPATGDSSGRAGKPMEQQEAKKGQETLKSAEHAGHEMNQEKPRAQDHNDVDTMAVVPETVVDPVCGMTITPDKERSYMHKGKTYFFCSDDDLEKFKKSPEKYVPDDQQH
ncbi:MAG TPA: efflux RND transporter periplasmic adaptor subunit [Bacteroidota bacterium]|nr:efflux RND transporter periplasmic adaptor subunit [Bacteroidota bacterium]